MFKKSVLVIVLIINAFLIEVNLWSCNCVSGLDDTVYLWATFILLPLPFVIFGLVAWFIMKKKRKADRKLES